MTRRVFLDMDGVVVDFDGHLRLVNLMRAEIGVKAVTGDEMKLWPGVYQGMPPIAGAIDGVRPIIDMGFDVWFASKPPTGAAHAYADKAAWVFKYLPELKRKLIITHDKGMLGCQDDFLVDDRPHRANCEAFRCPDSDPPHHQAAWTLSDWPELLDMLRECAPNRRSARGWMGDRSNTPFGPSD